MGESVHRAAERMRKVIEGLSSVRWGRVLLASVATHVINVAVTVLAVVVYALARTRAPGGGADFVSASSWPRLWGSSAVSWSPGS
jgi:hypothetical protein